MNKTVDFGHLSRVFTIFITFLTARKQGALTLLPFYADALKQEPQMLVEMLVKEVILYNDKAEIIFNTPTRMNLDESQGFSLGYSKKGKPITIEIACIRKMMKLINRRTSDYYRSVSLETLTPVSEPSYEIKEEVSQDYLYEKIVSSLNLTENMRIALECRQNGLSYPEIGRVLSRAQATVYEYFIKMRQRYMAIYG